MEKRLLLKKATQKMSNLLAKVTAKEAELLKLAAIAKREGRSRDYNQTLVYLKMYIARKEKTKSMLHQLQLIELIKDDAELSKQYVDSMRVISDETAKLYGGTDIRKTRKKFRRMSFEMEKSKGLLDFFLEEVDSTYELLANDNENIEIDKELEDQINKRIQDFELDLDDKIEKKLEKYSA